MTMRRRLRLTITLRPELVRKADQLIDKTRLRNRSQVIEYLLDQALAPRISQAVILAGGRGVKMRPLTYEIPKALIPIAGKPILEYNIDLLRSHGIKKIIFATGYLGGKIREHFVNGSRFGVEISYSQEKKTQGTGGALRLARKHLDTAPFLVLHGDVLAKIDLAALVSFHREHQGVATIALAVVKDVTQVGKVQLSGAEVKRFFQKRGKGLTSGLVNAGIYILEPEIFDYIPNTGTSMLEDILPKIAQEGKLFGFPFTEPWFDVSTPKAYEKSLKEWKRGEK